MRPPFKYHGGKWYLAPWIIDNFPANYTSLNYLEPFCRAASVFFRKERGKQEVLSDKDAGTISILRAIQNDVFFQKKLECLEYTKETFGRALENKYEPAINEFILRRMSRGGLKKSFGWSNRLRGGRPGDLNAWESIIKDLPRYTERLKGVSLENKSAMDIISIADSSYLIYADPPYVHSTRTVKKAYKYEMNNKEHEKLAGLLLASPAKIILSGYENPLYNSCFSSWRKLTRKIVNHASQAKSKQIKEEVLWLNF